MIFLILAGASVAFAAFLLVDVVTLSSRERAGSIRRAAQYGRTRVVSHGQLVDGSFRERALQPMRTGLARGVLRLMPKANVETISAKLLAARLNRRLSPTTYLATKGLAGFGADISGQVLAVNAGEPAG